MVAEGARDKRDVGAPLHDLVGRAQVVGPQEGLSSQLDARGEEGEHRDQDRHLQHHGQAATHRVGTRQAVQFHGLLLLLHRILGVGILLVDLGDVRRQESHLGLRDIGLVGQRREHHLQDDGQHQDDQSIVGHELAQPVKHGNDDAGVDPAEEFPSQGNQVGEFQVLFGRILVITREHVVAVRAHIEVERRRHGLVARVGHHRVHVDVLEVLLIVGRVLGVGAGQLGCREHAVGDEHGREELVLGAHPFQFLLDFLLVGAALAGILHFPTLAGKLVVDATVALLKLLAELVARDLLVPVEVHQIDVQRDDARHALLHHLHAHHVTAGHQGVLQSPLGAALEVEVHHHGAVVEALRREVEVFGLEALRVVAQGETVVVVALVKQHELGRLVRLVALERGAGDDAALGAQFYLERVVLEGDHLLGACQRGGKRAVLGIHVQCSLHGLHGQVMHGGVGACGGGNLAPLHGGVAHGDGAVDLAVTQREHHALVVDGGGIGGHVLQHAQQLGLFGGGKCVHIARSQAVSLLGLLDGSDRVDLSLTLGHFGLAGLVEPHEAEYHGSHQQHSNQSVLIHIYLSSR